MCDAFIERTSLVPTRQRWLKIGELTFEQVYKHARAQEMPTELPKHFLKKRHSLILFRKIRHWTKMTLIKLLS